MSTNTIKNEIAQEPMNELWTGLFGRNPFESAAAVANSHQLRDAAPSTSSPFQIFNYLGRDIRIELRDGKPWFVLADACKILDLGTTSRVADRLDPAGVSKTHTRDSLGLSQELIIVNEPNLYRVVFRSNKAEAKDFQDWLFEDVLPSIRETGSYAVPDVESALPLAPFEQLALFAAEKLGIHVTGVYEELPARKASMGNRWELIADLVREANGQWVSLDIEGLSYAGMKTAARDIRNGKRRAFGPGYDARIHRGALHVRHCNEITI